MRTTQTNAARTNENANLVGDVCLYGSMICGGGFIARSADGMFGNGEPVVGRSMTETLWAACDAIVQASADRDSLVGKVVRVFAAGGKRYADCSVTCPPIFGRLTWNDASEFNLVISAADIIAAAEPN